MRTILGLTIALATCWSAMSHSSISVNATEDSARDIYDSEPRPRTYRNFANGPSFEHITLREGRTISRGPRGMRDQYPYLVASNSSERKQQLGYPVTAATVGFLFEPITTPKAALEMTRWLYGGDLVPDRAAFDRMVNVAKNHELPEGSWPIEWKRNPEHFGMLARSIEGGVEVRGTIFTSSARMTLSVCEIHAVYRPGKAAEVKREWCLVGPPQSWQTAGDVDENEQARLRAAIESLRDHLLQALRKDLPLAGFEKAIAEKWSWAKLRHTIGEPNRTRGIPGTYNAMYRLGNGQVIALASGLEDQPVPGAILYQSFTADYGFGAQVKELTAN